MGGKRALCLESEFNETDEGVLTMSSVGRPLSALLVAVVFWVTFALAAPFGWGVVFLVVAALLAVMSYWMPGRLGVLILGGVIPVVILIAVRNALDSHQFFARLNLHGPNFVMILGAVAFVMGVPAVAGLAAGDWLGRRRQMRQARV